MSTVDTTTDSDAATLREFLQDGKRFLPLGGQKKNVFVVPDVFAGQVRVNIREYFLAKEDSSDSDTEDKTEQRDYYLPTKKGVSLTIVEFEQLCNKLESAKKIVKRLQKKLHKRQEQKKKKKTSPPAERTEKAVAGARQRSKKN